VAELSGAPTAVGALADSLRAVPGLTVSGPIEHGAGSRALVRAVTSAALADALAETAAPARAKGRLRIDVDPGRV
jgi:hypothetical protein